MTGELAHDIGFQIGSDPRKPFITLSEYDLRHVVGHLIASVHEQQKHAECGISSDAQLLVKLLAHPGFGLSQAATLGAEATIADFVAGYEIISATLPEKGRDISRALAVATIISSLADGAALTPDALNALLTYRTDTRAYNDVLSFATDRTLIARITKDEPDRSWLERVFLHSAATTLRRLGRKENIDRARQMLIRARDAGIDLPITDGPAYLRSERVLSSILYDLAYIDYLTERPSDARAGFQISAQAAEKARNTSGRYMSLLLQNLIDFHSLAMSAESYRAFLEQALAYFINATKESPHAERAVMSTRAYLFDVACLTADSGRVDADYAVLEKDPWVAKFHRVEMIQTWRARRYMAHRAWREAAALYESILEHDLCQPAEDVTREWIVRDALDYGTALAAQGSIELAKHVWELGMRSSEYTAGWPWRTAISRRLAEARQATILPGMCTLAYLGS